MLIDIQRQVTSSNTMVETLTASHSGTPSVTSEETHRMIDELEKYIIQNGGMYRPRGRAGADDPFPYKHTFTPGLYVREIAVPAGFGLTSEVHKTEHPWVLSKGILEVWSEDSGWQLLEAPAAGVTRAGTRRLIKTHTDIVWTTFHANPNNTQDIAVLEDMIYEPRRVDHSLWLDG